jgi:hypothetical protein
MPARSRTTERLGTSLCALVAAAWLLVLAAAGSASAEPRVIVRSTSTGPGARASVRASGIESLTMVLRYHVTVAPLQRVRVSWRVACTLDGKPIARFGIVTARAPIERVVRPPSRAVDCTVRVTGRIWKDERGRPGSGFLAVSLLEGR